MKLNVQFGSSTELKYNFKLQATQKSKQGLIVYGTATSPTLDLDNEKILFKPSHFNEVAKNAFLEEKNVYNAEVPGRMVWNHGRDFSFEDVDSEADYSDPTFYPESKVIGQVLSLDYKPTAKTKKFDIDDDDSMDYYFKHAKVEASFVITDPEMIERFDKQEMGVSISWYPINPETTRRYIGSGSNNVNQFIEREYFLREISLTPTPANTDTFDLTEATPEEVEKLSEPSNASGFEVGDLVEYAEMRAEILSKRTEEGMNFYTLKFADSTMKSRSEFTDEQIKSVKEETKMITTDEIMNNFKSSMAENLGVEDVSYEIAGFLWFNRDGKDYMTDFYTQDNKYFDLPFEFNLAEPFLLDELSEDAVELEKTAKMSLDTMKALRTSYNSRKFDNIIKSALEKKFEMLGYKNEGFNELRYVTPKFDVNWTNGKGVKQKIKMSLDSENQVTFYNKPTNMPKDKSGIKLDVSFSKYSPEDTDK